MAVAVAVAVSVSVAVAVAVAVADSQIPSMPSGFEKRPTSSCKESKSLFVLESATIFAPHFANNLTVARPIPSKQLEIRLARF